MKRLSPEEVTREVHDITTRPWPQNSALRMKNLYDQRLGVIFRTWNGGPETIIPTIMEGGTHKETAYKTVQALVEAGWVVD